MVTYLAKKYAHLLTKEDIVTLFDLLKKKTGSQSGAAKLCDLTRKTTYDWKEIDDLKGETKEKVLSVLIDNLPKETLALIADRASKYARDSIATYLSVVHSLALQSTSSGEFEENTKLFDQARTRYGGLVAGMYENEIGKMVSDLNQHARSLGTDWHPAPVRIFSERHISELLPSLVSQLTATSPNFVQISQELQVSTEFASELHKVLPRAPQPVQPVAIPYRAYRNIRNAICHVSELQDLSYMHNSPASTCPFTRAATVRYPDTDPQVNWLGTRWMKVDPGVAGLPLSPEIGVPNQ